MILLALALIAADPRLVVDFSAERTEDAWAAAAFEENAEHDLAGHRAIVVKKAELDTTACPARDAPCLLDAYIQGGADIVILGKLNARMLDFEVFVAWSKARVAHETIPLEAKKPGLGTVRDQMVHALRPIFMAGGLLEKERFRANRAETIEEEAPLGPLRAGILLAIAVALLLSPMAFKREPLRDAVSWRWTMIAIAGLAVLSISFFLPIAALLPAWLLPMIGGALWASLILLNLRFALPAMPGLSSIRHGSVGRVLRAWLMSCLRRLFVLAVLHAPLFLLVPRSTWIIVVPIGGLVLHLWLLAMVDHLSSAIDHKLVLGSANTDNPWHPIIKKYFLGYARRAGLELDRDVLERTLFLPGRAAVTNPLLEEGIAVYGGGLAHARIVVDEALLETALHAIPEERLVDDEEGNGGALELGDPDGVLLPSDDPNAPMPKRSKRARPPARASTFRPLLGQNETLLGVIHPLPLDESAPLVIDDRDEYSVLRHLLTAHYAAFNQGRWGEELVDDTDPTQKDFLFGALLREVGSIERKDSLIHALALNLKPKQRKQLFTKSAEIIADGYAALNRGLHPLIQHLDYLRTKSDAHLTARADEPMLAGTTAEILRRVLAEDEKPQDRAQRRLFSLAEYLSDDVPMQRSKLRVAVYAVAALLVGAFAVSAIKETFDYQPVYEKRMRELELKVEQAKQKGEPADGH